MFNSCSIALRAHSSQNSSEAFKANGFFAVLISKTQQTNKQNQEQQQQKNKPKTPKPQKTPQEISPKP